MKLQRKFFIVSALVAMTFGSWAGGRSSLPLTLVAVPAEYTPLELGQDLAARYPVVLVSYQDNPGAGGLFLHAWDGRGWVEVSEDEFAGAGFVQMTPKRSVVIGSGSVAGALVDLAGGWCPDVLNLASSKSSDIVNTVGRLFGFNKSEWRYFAKKYDMELEDLNAGRRKESWYDQPYTDPERVGRGSMLVPVAQPTSHTMMWPPSAPAVVEEVDSVGRVSAGDVVEADVLGEEVAVESDVSLEGESVVEEPRIRPPSFRGWQAGPSGDASLMDLK